MLSSFLVTQGDGTQSLRVPANLVHSVPHPKQVLTEHQRSKKESLEIDKVFADRELGQSVSCQVQ